jgi:hypothetical protein
MSFDIMYALFSIFIVLAALFFVVIISDSMKHHKHSPR